MPPGAYPGERQKGEQNGFDGDFAAGGRGKGLPLLPMEFPYSQI